VKYKAAFLLFFAICFSSFAARFNAFGLKFETVNTEHFRILTCRIAGLVDKVAKNWSSFTVSTKILRDFHSIQNVWSLLPAITVTAGHFPIPTP
jgi:hypothetical protein